jgi:hypothetical protein
MHRIARRDLESLVFVAITCASPAIKRGLKSKLLEERDKARGELARSICDKIDNDSYMVIVTELIAQSSPYPRRGEWGVDEPVPATVPVPPPPLSGDWKL